MVLIVFNGMAPTMDYGRTWIVLGFELLTIVVELLVVFGVMRLSGADNRRLRFALYSVMGANLVSFCVGAVVYSWLNGSDWLVTVWGGLWGPPSFTMVLAVLTAIGSILFFMVLLCGGLCLVLRHVFPDAIQQEAELKV